MQKNYNVTTPKSTPAFGAIRYDSAENVIRNLTSRELKEFATLFNKQKNNTAVDVILFSRGSKKLTANVADNIFTSNREVSQCKSKSQRFFESPVNFIKRCCSSADKRAQEIQEIIEKENILNNLK